MSGGLKPRCLPEIRRYPSILAPYICNTRAISRHFAEKCRSWSANQVRGARGSPEAARYHNTRRRNDSLDVIGRSSESVSSRMDKRKSSCLENFGF